MSPPLTRCLAVAAAALAGAAALLAWLLPVAAAPAPGLDGALVRLSAASGAVITSWLAAVALAVTLEAGVGGRWQTPGVPPAVRRVLLAACGVAVAAGLAGPAQAAAGGDAAPPAARPSPVHLTGLPLPERPTGLPHDPVVVVRPGDCLWTIAAERLGDGERWVELYAANRAAIGADPDLIHPAQRLRLPDLPTERPSERPKENR